MTLEAGTEVVHARAPGKINVFLRVGALLDDGYHDVATAYQAVSLYEDVRAYPADDFSVNVAGSVDPRAEERQLPADLARGVAERLELRDLLALQPDEACEHGTGHKRRDAQERRRKGDGKPLQDPQLVVQPHGRGVTTPSPRLDGAGSVQAEPAPEVADLRGALV